MSIKLFTYVFVCTHTEGLPVVRVLIFKNNCSFWRLFNIIILKYTRVILYLFWNNTLHLLGHHLLCHPDKKKVLHWLCYNTVTLERSAGVSLCLVFINDIFLVKEMVIKKIHCWPKAVHESYLCNHIILLLTFFLLYIIFLCNEYKNSNVYSHP